MSNTSLSAVGNKKARMLRRLKNASRQPEYPIRKRQRPHRSRRKMLEAINGSRGILSVVAKRLQCHANTVATALNQSGWELVLEAFKDERTAALGGCVRSMFEIAEFGLDINARLAASKFLLEKLHPSYHPKRTISVEGGNIPIRHIVLTVPAAAADLPINDRLALLELADAQEAEFVE